jgi:hypothetical protein
MYAMLEAKIDIHSRVVDLYKNLLDPLDSVKE